MQRTQQDELSTQREDSTAGVQHVLKLWITEADRELFQIAGNPPVKAFVASTDFRNTVVHRAAALGVRLDAIDWRQQRLTPDVQSDQLLFGDWQRSADSMGIQARIVIPARATGRAELQLQLKVVHEEVVENADEPPQTLPPPTNLPMDEKFKQLQDQLMRILETTDAQGQQIEILGNANGYLRTKNVEQDVAIQELRTKNMEQDEKIKTQNKKIETQNKKIKTLQSENGGQRTLIDDLRKENAERDEKIDDLRTKNAEQDEKLETQDRMVSELLALTRRGREVALRGMLEEYMHLKGLFPSLPAVEGEDKNAALRRL